MPHKLTEEEETENIKETSAEGLIIIYQASDTDPKLKQKIQDELFDRLVTLESFVLKIANEKRTLLDAESGEEKSFWEKLWE